MSPPPLPGSKLLSHVARIQQMRSNENKLEDGLSSRSCRSMVTTDSSATVGDGTSVEWLSAAPYVCQYCTKAFAQLSYLKKHQETHGEETRFRCWLCPRLFRHKRSRDRHLKLHTGDKRYRCTRCHAAFSRSDHLKIHSRSHDNRKAFQCRVCWRCCTSGAGLSWHMRHTHGSSTTGPLTRHKHPLPLPGVAQSQLTNFVKIKVESSKRAISPTRIEVSSGPLWLPCAFCPPASPTFTSVESLQDHLNSVHGTEADPKEWQTRQVDLSLGPEADINITIVEQDRFGKTNSHHSGFFSLPIMPSGVIKQHKNHKFKKTRI